MNRNRIALFVVVIFLSIALFAMVGPPTMTLQYADAQYSTDGGATDGSTDGSTTGSTTGSTSGGSSSSDDDDDDDGDGGGVPGIPSESDNFNDGRLNDDITAPTVAFCEQGAITFYSVLGRGNAKVTRDELLDGFVQATLLGGQFKILDSGVVTLIVSQNRTLLIAAADKNGEIYQFTVPLNVCGGISGADFVDLLENAEIESDEADGEGVINEDGTYTVQTGDSLSSIADDFNTTVNALVEANDIEDPDRIRDGQVLIIP